MTNRIQVKTLLTLLRGERKAAAAKGDLLAVKKIDFIGIAINRLIDKQGA